MTIENGYYISNCTSTDTPLAHQDENTFYFPFDVKAVDGGYEYKEYRIDINADATKLPTEIILYLAKELDAYRKAIEKLGEKMNQNPEKLGYKWKPIYTDGNFNYEMIEDENAEGTQKNPIEWEPGMMVREYFFYTDGKDTYVGVGTGIPESIQDTNYLEKM